MEHPVYIGIDFHQHHSSLSVLDPDGHELYRRRCGSSVLEILGAVPIPPGAVHAALEAGCGSADLAEALAEAGWSVSLAHPGYVARLRQSPDKSDTTDARLLADLTRVGYLPKVWLAPRSVRELRELVRERQRLADERRRVKQQVRGLLRDHRQRCPTARPWTRAWLGWLADGAELGGHSRWVLERRLAHLAYLQTQIEAAERRLREATHDDPVVAKLMRLAGIGEVTAWTLRALIGRFDRFANGKQLARFCGVSPRNASSGERVADAGLVKAGDPLLRATLIEAAHRLGMHDPRWRAFRDHLRAQGKPGSVVAAAIANRWVRGLYHQMCV